MTILGEINAIISDDIKAYARSLFVDLRLSQDIHTQYTREPLGFPRIVKIVKDKPVQFLHAVRELGPNAYETGNEIERTLDPIRKIALWVYYTDTN